MTSITRGLPTPEQVQTLTSGRGPRDAPLQQHVDAGRDRQEAVCYGKVCADDLMDQVNDGSDPLAVLNHI